MRSRRYWLVVCAFAVAAAAAAAETAGEQETLKVDFLKMCDLACSELNKEITPFQESYRTTPDPKTHHVPFFEDAYAVRALCAAYDITGKTEYLQTCKHWADRVVALQDGMIPKGAYYLNYFREPGKEEGQWFVADSGSVAMGVLATAVRCTEPADRERYLNSCRGFAQLVIDNYLGKGGGITDGLWSGSKDEWWCSTATCGAFFFLLHEATHDAKYLTAASGALDWMLKQDLRKVGPISFDECAPGVIFYCFEFYTAALHALTKESEERKAVMAQVDMALQWLTENQKGRGANSRWDYLGDGTYMGGMPYLMYRFAQELPEPKDRMAEADRELRYITGLLFQSGPPPVERLTTWELMSWAMMSCAERLSPGSILRTSLDRTTQSL